MAVYMAAVGDVPWMYKYRPTAARFPNTILQLLGRPLIGCRAGGAPLLPSLHLPVPASRPVTTRYTVPGPPCCAPHDNAVQVPWRPTDVLTARHHYTTTK